MTAELVSDAQETVSFELNGSPATVLVFEGETLLQTLRDRLGITSPKDGCSPQGQCGCCVVNINGQGVTSCAMLTTKVAGKRVVTNEGLPEQERTIIARAFATSGGVQCGFCIPGFVARTAAILGRDANPSREQIKKQLGVHLCRCTGYVKILDAIELAGAVKRGERELPPLLTQACGVGKRLPKYQAEAYALGDVPYVDDMSVPGMLHGAVHLSEHPRAKILRIDTSQAEALPGVVVVATAKDVRGRRRYGLIEQDWPSFVAEGETTCMVGDVLVAVAAVDRRTARRAAELCVVTYEVFEPIVDGRLALADDSPTVHPGRKNLLSTSAYVRGDVDAALANSAFVVSDTFRTQTIEHLYMEPESCLVVPEGDKLHVYSQGQGIYDDRRQLSRALDLPEALVEVTLVSNGGAFGGKEDLSIQAQTALLAQLTHKPVKLTVSRDESIRIHPKRHPLEMHYTMACDANGKLTAVKARMLADSGAYASVGAKVVERAVGHACGPYYVPAADVLGQAVYTNNTPNGAMRGFGVNQSAFAVEQLIDRLAEKCGLDAYQMRERNLLRDGERFGPGQKMKNCGGLLRTLEAVKDCFYGAKIAGLACGVKNVGIGNGMIDVGRARIDVLSGGRLRLCHGMTEMGQGLHTIAIQVMYEATGLAPQEGVTVEVTTDDGLDCGMTTASRATVLVGNAMKDAGEKLRAELDLLGGELSALAGKSYTGEWKCDFTVKPGTPGDNPITHLSFGFATQVVLLDENTGKIRRVVAAHDVGKAINPTLCEGQIEGSVHMGLGYALSEELVLEGGVPVDPTMRKLGVLRAHETPDIEVILVEEPEPLGPYGARGVGEIGLVPTAPAVAQALYKFDGRWRTTLPMRDHYEKPKR
ncbi:MAG: selenium-dependent xanthine dehydrogenase [Myxococcales bacterium]|nr:selenium-dependent xanthine dehydrogenase [Myxococcales bacterium]